MKIIRFIAENVKKLQAVEIVPDGSVVQITGPNGSGKSSVLDAIYWALAGAKGIDSQPIRRGAHSATIKLELGEITVTRRFTGSGTSLVVEAANGARFPSPQKLLDELLGTLTFDPLAFARMEPGRQLEQLRGMVELDVDIDALDAMNQHDYQRRTDVNRRVKDLTARMNAHHVADDLPAEMIDVSALLAEMEQAAELNARRERDRGSVENWRRNAQENRTQAAALRKRAAELEQEAVELETDADDVERQIPESIDVSDLRRQINSARELNEQVAQRNHRDAIRRELDEAEALSAALTAAIEERTRGRQDAIGAAVMPIAGLSFGDGEVLYNGIPFSQASSAEQLRVSVAIAMAANPKLRVLRIKDGSLLDERSLALIAEMAEAGDYQVWIERVDTSGRVGVVMEEGSIRAVECADESAPVLAATA